MPGSGTSRRPFGVALLDVRVWRGLLPEGEELTNKGRINMSKLSPTQKI